MRSAARGGFLWRRALFRLALFRLALFRLALFRLALFRLALFRLALFRRRRGRDRGRLAPLHSTSWRQSGPAHGELRAKIAANPSNA